MATTTTIHPHATVMRTQRPLSTSYDVRNPDGLLDRTHGPAAITVRTDGTCVATWMRQGCTHRADGPALMWADGSTLWLIGAVEIADVAPYMDQKETV